MEKIRCEFDWTLMRRKDDNEKDERARTLHISKRLREDEKTQAFLNNLSTIDGIEGIQPQGPYAISIFIAHCFVVDPIVEEIEQLIKSFLSDLVIPGPKALQLVKNND